MNVAALRVVVTAYGDLTDRGDLLDRLDALEAALYRDQPLRVIR